MNGRKGQFSSGGPQWCSRVMKRLRRERGNTGVSAMGPVYASSDELPDGPAAYLPASASEPTPKALPVSFTAPTVASTARPTPVAATPTAALATETTAHPPSKALERTAAMIAAREISLGMERGIVRSWYCETGPILRMSCKHAVSHA